eukprot:7642134-Pyramimonas_sp.AAC.1
MLALACADTTRQRPFAGVCAKLEGVRSPASRPPACQLKEADTREPRRVPHVSVVIINMFNRS